MKRTFRMMVTVTTGVTALSIAALVMIPAIGAPWWLAAISGALQLLCLWQSVSALLAYRKLMNQ